MSLELCINMDQRCAECHKLGALPSGICLRCAMRALDDPSVRRFKSAAARAVQQTLQRASALPRKTERG